MGKTGWVLLLLAGASASNALASGFDEWRRQNQSEFQAFKDARDKAFLDMLTRQWQEMKMLRGMVRDATPKPAEIPVAPKPDEPSPAAVPGPPRPEPGVPEPELAAPKAPAPHRPAPDLVPPKTPAPPPQRDRPGPPPAPVITERPRPPAPAPALPGQEQSVVFFGHRLRFQVPADVRLTLPPERPMDETVISAAWEALSRSDYEPLVRQLDAQAKPLELGDWARVQLTYGVSGVIAPDSDNERLLMTWFLLAKQGFDARIAFDKKSVYLLLPAQQQLYETTYFRLDGINYYLARLNPKAAPPRRVFTYDGHYPEADQRLDMRFARTVKTAAKVGERKVSFTFKGRRYTLTLPYNAYLIDFYATYPQLDLPLYFAAEPGVDSRQALVTQLRPLLQGRSEKEAVDFLLRFVQTAFKYETDDRQFGEENYLLPDETIYYAFSDCEDRAVMFAWLVRKLLGLEVVGLSYPGHVATAVAFKTRVAGDSVTYKGKTYVIADPTYINANAGMAMPATRGQSPKVVPTL